MEQIHFAAANGFPARSYEYLFSKMDFVKIDYINTIGHVPSNNKANHGFLKDEMIAHLDKNFDKPIIGIGHSAGGATIMLAAAERPELFKKIILIDPPLFSASKRFVLGIAIKLGIWKKVGLASKALRRRSTFNSKEQAFGYWKDKALFRKFHPESFANYVEHGLKPSGDQFELAFSANVEADIFQNIVINFPKIAHLDATLIYAKKGDLLSQNDLAWWKKKHPNFEMIGFEGRHLFPFEQPDETALLLKDLLSKDDH